MRFIILSVVALLGFSISGYSQDHEPAIVAQKDATVTLQNKDGNTFSPNHLFFLKKQVVVPGLAYTPAPIPTLKEKGDGNLLVVSGLYFSEYKPVIIPNKYEENELIKEPVKVTIQSDKFP